ncbi:hypothetical protein SUGI_0232100 [Cryptomeria japonica]|nr:hypothetical protein SUGI_0232100 [Cryptomeria japonica]
MPNLVRLELGRNSKCRELPKAFGNSGRFSHLRFFSIQDINELEGLPELEEGAMACLEELNIEHCRNLKKVGDGLERLKRLKLFNYCDSGTKEVREALKDGGEYCKKIKFINPHVLNVDGT